MSAVLPAILLSLCVSVCVQAQGRTLAVVPRPTPELDSVSAATLQDELHRLLAPAGVNAIWQPAARDQFELLVVASIDGECSAEGQPVLPQSGLPANVLGETQLSGSGRILPFLRVDCAGVIRTLSPILQPLSIPQRSVILGRALARVMAHEIYHILSQAASHGGYGAAKASFSAQDLIAAHFGFDPVSLSRMVQASPAVTPVAHVAGASHSRD